MSQIRLSNPRLWLASIVSVSFLVLAGLFGILWLGLSAAAFAVLIFTLEMDFPKRNAYSDPVPAIPILAALALSVFAAFGLFELCNKIAEL